MRVATTTLFSISTSGLQKHISDQAKLQEQLSSGRRVLTPADDPIASARALTIEQTASINAQYATNSGSADSALSLTESTISQVVKVIQDVQSLTVQAGDAALSKSEKEMLATELNGRYEELLGLANSRDGNGIYMFSGFQGATEPFSQVSFGSVTYNGDEGQRKIQISSGRQIPISENGSAIFQKIKNGNGTYSTGAATGNLGSGIISPGEVLDPGKWAAAPSPQDFSVQFYWAANPDKPTEPIVTYDLIDNTTGASLIDGTASAATRTTGPRSYVAGGSIDFKQLPGETAVPAWDYGARVSVEGLPVQVDPETKLPVGTPGASDSFNVVASSNVDLFSTMGDFSVALTEYMTDGSGMNQALFQNRLNDVMQRLSNGLTNVLTVQASIGSRMKETESVQDTNEDLQLQYSKTLSGLRDLDYAQAISDFSQNQMLLEATRQSFAKVQGLSLFNYIS
jgi:flagellar hook-associated protein 3 FlgL